MKGATGLKYYLQTRQSLLNIFQDACTVLRICSEWNYRRFLASNREKFCSCVPVEAEIIKVNVYQLKTSNVV